MNKIIFHGSFRKLELLCYFYDANKTDKNKNKILIYCLDEIEVDPEMLEIINHILKEENGGYKFIKILYKYMGVEMFEDIDDDLDYLDE